MVIPRDVEYMSEKVLYIGTANPLETSKGLEAVQLPLRQRYSCKDEELQGIDARLSVTSSGLMLQFDSEKGPAILLFPIAALTLCAAVKRVMTKNVATGEHNINFISVKDPKAKDLASPAVFTAITRRTKGRKVLECHGFVCRSDQIATNFVKAAAAVDKGKVPVFTAPTPRADFSQSIKLNGDVAIPNEYAGPEMHLIPGDVALPMRDTTNEFYDEPHEQGYFYALSGAEVKKFNVGKAFTPVETPRTIPETHVEVPNGHVAPPVEVFTQAPPPLVKPVTVPPPPKMVPRPSPPPTPPIEEIPVFIPQPRPPPVVITQAPRPPPMMVKQPVMVRRPPPVLVRPPPPRVVIPPPPPGPAPQPPPPVAMQRPMYIRRMPPRHFSPPPRLGRYPYMMPPPPGAFLPPGAYPPPGAIPPPGMIPPPLFVRRRPTRQRSGSSGSGSPGNRSSRDTSPAEETSRKIPNGDFDSDSDIVRRHRPRTPPRDYDYPPQRQSRRDRFERKKKQLRNPPMMFRPPHIIYGPPPPGFGYPPYPGYPPMRSRSVPPPMRYPTAVKSGKKKKGKKSKRRSGIPSDLSTDKGSVGYASEIQMPMNGYPYAGYNDYSLPRKPRDFRESQFMNERNFSKRIAEETRKSEGRSTYPTAYELNDPGVSGDPVGDFTLY